MGFGHAQKIPELLLAEIFHGTDLGALVPTAAWWCCQGGIVPVILLENGVTASGQVPRYVTLETGPRASDFLSQKQAISFTLVTI